MKKIIFMLLFFVFVPLAGRCGFGTGFLIGSMMSNGQSSTLRSELIDCQEAYDAVKKRNSQLEEEVQRLKKSLKECEDDQ